MSLWSGKGEKKEKKEKKEWKGNGGGEREKKKGHSFIALLLRACALASQVLLNAALRHAVPLTRDFLGASHSL